MCVGRGMLRYGAPLAARSRDHAAGVGFRWGFKAVDLCAVLQEGRAAAPVRRRSRSDSREKVGSLERAFDHWPQRLLAGPQWVGVGFLPRK